MKGASADKDWTGEDHYKEGIEVLHILKAKLTPEQYQGFLLGNILKYPLRLNYVTPGKTNLATIIKKKLDLRKCKHYCDLLIKELGE